MVAGPATAHADRAAPAEMRCSIHRGGTVDALAPVVSRRATFRGTFGVSPASSLDALERRLAPLEVTVVRDHQLIHELAALADEASDEFLANPHYWSETWKWLRLSPSHADWARDGLNADALALSPIERMAGRWLMAPAAFEGMRRLGLARALVSEIGRAHV